MSECIKRVYIAILPFYIVVGCLCPHNTSINSFAKQLITYLVFQPYNRTPTHIWQREYQGNRAGEVATDKHGEGKENKAEEPIHRSSAVSNTRYAKGSTAPTVCPIAAYSQAWQVWWRKLRNSWFRFYFYNKTIRAAAAPPLIHVYPMQRHEHKTMEGGR